MALRATPIFVPVLMDLFDGDEIKEEVDCGGVLVVEYDRLFGKDVVILTGSVLVVGSGEGDNFGMAASVTGIVGNVGTRGGMLKDLSGQSCVSMEYQKYVTSIDMVEVFLLNS
jgi:hypothetical protein